MKKLLPILLAFLSINLNAQAPQGFNYQASIRDSSNNIVANQSVGIQMTIIQGSLSGTNVYQETFADSTSATGVVSIVIGEGSAVSGSFSGIDWGNGPYFIETAVDISGGTTYQVMGTQQLMSVPYALYSEKAKLLELTDTVGAPDVTFSWLTSLDLVTMTSLSSSFSETVMFQSNKGYFNGVYQHGCDVNNGQFSSGDTMECHAFFFTIDGGLKKAVGIYTVP